jgi:hypothetical protein
LITNNNDNLNEQQSKKSTNLDKKIDIKSVKTIDLTDKIDINEDSDRNTRPDNIWSEIRLNFKDLPKHYAALSKQNLTSK